MSRHRATGSDAMWHAGARIAVAMATLAAAVALAMAALAAAVAPAWAALQPDTRGAAAAATAARRPRRLLPAAALSLSPPALAAPLLSGVRATVRPVTGYRGEGVVTYELLAGPEGMSLDTGSGLLLWTPPAAAEGTAPEVRVRATDGTASAQTAFSLPVAAPTPVPATLAGQTLTATAGSLQGVGWTFPASASRPLAELAVATLPAGQAPPLPPDATPVSDLFRVTPVAAGDGGAITVALPKRLVPAGRASHELRLWVYTDRIDGAVAPDWVCTWRERDVLPGGTATMKLKNLGELSFVGVPSTPVAAPPAAGAAVRATSSTPIAGLQAVTTTCEQKLLADGTRDPSTQHCTVASVPPFEVWVKDFDRHQWTPRATVQDLAGWLVAARARAAALGLTSEPVFEVVVENVPEPTWLGFVTSAEDYWTLHLDEEARRTRDRMQCTTAHEFFHHAQSRTRIAGLQNALTEGGQQTQWLVEGTARWFEDDVFDALDSYRLLNASPLAPILAPGLAATPAPPPANDPERNPYNRFAFFKMLSSRCPGFDAKALLNANLAADPGATARLRSLVQGWRCDFGPAFGTTAYARSLPGTGLALYALATQYLSDITALDANEPAYRFQAQWDGAVPRVGCLGPGSCPREARATGTLAPLAARVVEILPSGAVPANHEVVVDLVTGEWQGDWGGFSWAWLGDGITADMLPLGFATGPATVRWRAGLDTESDELVAVFVNPDPTHTVPYAAYAKVLNREPKTLLIGINREYRDASLGLPIDVFRYRLTAQATLTGLGGMQFPALDESPDPYPGTWTQTVLSSGLTPPYTVALAGTIDVEPIPPAGSYRPAGAARTFHWQFGQKRFVNDCANRVGISDTPGFTLVFTAADGAEQFTGGPCVEFTFGTWETDDKGAIYNNWGYSFSPRGRLVLDVNPY